MKKRVMSMGLKILKISLAGLLSFIVFHLAAMPAWSGNKRMMSVRAAKVLAERGLLETIYGFKLKASESVEDLVAASYLGSSETKTTGQLKGVHFEEIVYNEENDIAKVTAAVQMASITNIDGNTVDLGNKTYRRTAYATSTPGMTGAVAALRAAELDAYTQLIKRIVGFRLESRTSMENYLLTSDMVKTKIMATLYLAEVKEFGWEKNGDAYVKMQVNVGEVSDVMGETVVGEGDVVEVTGQGAQQDDFKKAK